MADEQKNKGGRPPIHTDPEHLDTLVKDYFDYIQGDFEEIERENDEGDIEVRRKYTRQPEPPTVTGLALHIGFSSKDTLYQYAKKPEFSDSIKKGILRIEKFHEIRTSYGDKCTGNIFILKNFGWKDKIEQEIVGKQEIVWKEEKTYEANEETD